MEERPPVPAPGSRGPAATDPDDDPQLYAPIPSSKFLGLDDDPVLRDAGPGSWPSDDPGMAGGDGPGIVFGDDDGLPGGPRRKARAGKGRQDGADKEGGEAGANFLDGPAGKAGASFLGGPAGKAGASFLDGPAGKAGAGLLGGPTGKAGASFLDGPVGKAGAGFLGGPAGKAGAGLLGGPAGKAGASFLDGPARKAGASFLDTRDAAGWPGGPGGPDAEDGPDWPGGPGGTDPEDGPGWTGGPGGTADDPRMVPVASLRRKSLLDEAGKTGKAGKARGRAARGAKGSGSRGQKLPGAKGPGLFRRLLVWVFWAMLGVTVFCMAVAFVAYAYYSQDLPSVESLRTYRPSASSLFYSRDGRVIGEFFRERRYPVTLDQIPQHVRNAFLAVEDRAFYRHQGVNLKAVVRAGINNLTGKDLQGGSTITQQLVRGILLSNERTLSRKIREMILAYRLEAALPKDRILELYLNQIYLGQGAYGVEAAAREYFDKHASQLSVAEAAMLAGITQSPEGKNPLRHPDEARRRQLHAIGAMSETGFLAEPEALAARSEILSIQDKRPNPNTTEAPYFTEHVRRVLAERYGEDALYTAGLRVHTTLSMEDQMAADRAVARGLWEYARRRGFRGPAARYGSDAEIAAALKRQSEGESQDGLRPARLYEAVVLEVRADSLAVQTGDYPGVIEKKNLAWILPKGALSKQLSRGDAVWVRLDDSADAPGALTESREIQLRRIASGQADAEGSRSFVLEQKTDVQAAFLSMDLADGGVRAMVGGRDFAESQFNRATQARRQPGSSFKPIIYAAAMDAGFTPGSVMVDGPVVVDDIGSRRRWKPMNSDRKFLGPMPLYNALVSSRNLVSVKVLERIGFDRLDETAAALGITEKLPRSLAVALGAHGLPMPELVGAYSAFPNNGVRAVPRYVERVEDMDGNLVESFEPQLVAALPPPTACILTWMLRGAVAQGTGSAVKPLGRPVGGKTGTTNDASDAWFVGFTPEQAAAVWFGTDELKPRGVGEVGGRAAAPVFLYYMQEALKDLPERDFTVPPGAVIEKGGAFGICYREGTLGTGISETAAEHVPEEDFLRGDMSDETFLDSGADALPAQGL
jgi:penicillin-binding protein 1A